MRGKDRRHARIVGRHVAPAVQLQDVTAGVDLHLLAFGARLRDGQKCCRADGGGKRQDETGVHTQTLTRCDGPSGRVSTRSGECRKRW
jgi:hypothetical protein